MKVTFVNYYYDKDIPIDKYLDKYPTIHGWSKSLQDLGLNVSVYHRFGKDYQFERDKVKYLLVKDDFRNDLKWYQAPTAFHKKIVETEHDVMHIGSFNYSLQASHLKKMCPESKVVIQHHAEKYGHIIKRSLLRNFTSLIDGFIFSSAEIYNEWLKTKTLPATKKFAEIMEGSSSFTFMNRDQMRRKTKFQGKPIFIWIGRLNENKDPITVLSGFLKLLNDFPKAKLYMIYSEDNLKDRVLSFINQNKSLLTNVELLGYINHNEISDYYNSAEYFVLGSKYEGSGYSLVEAMSCGVVPIVTDIPSFRMITDRGKIGGLWKSGDSESFYKKAKEIIYKPLDNEVKKTLDMFSENLSFTAIARKAKMFYESLLKN